MSALLVLLLAVAGASWWWLRHGLTEQRIANFYAAQVDAFQRQDLVAIASQYASDYRGFERQVGPGGTRKIEADLKLACTSVAMLFAWRRKWEAQQAAVEGRPMRHELRRTSTRIAASRRSADVGLAFHLSLGDALVVESTAVDHLVWRDGRVLSLRSDADSRVGGTLMSAGFVAESDA